MTHQSTDVTLELAIYDVLVGGNHLASCLLGMKLDPPSFTSYDEVLEKHFQPAADIWIAWKRIMELRDAQEKHRATLSKPVGEVMSAEDFVHTMLEHSNGTVAHKRVTEIIKARDAQLSKPVIPVGYALVPIEPTVEMVIAAKMAVRKHLGGIPEKQKENRYPGGIIPGDKKHRLRYKAMIAAAPKDTGANKPVGDEV